MKSPGHADSYQGLTVNYIPGKQPELVCFKGDVEVQRVPLQGESLEGCHKLVRKHGFKQTVAPGQGSVQGNPLCWTEGFGYNECCLPEYGPEGNGQCWDGVFTYEKCCFAPKEEL